MPHRGAPSRGDLDGVRFGLALQQLSVYLRAFDLQRQVAELVDAEPPRPGLSAPSAML